MDPSVEMDEGSDDEYLPPKELKKLAAKRQREGGNKGLKYEDEIKKIMMAKVGARPKSGKCDTEFIHNHVRYFVEVKNKDAVDYGQKKINWNIERKWYWAEEDVITEKYDRLGILSREVNKFKPNRYAQTGKFSKHHKTEDFKNFRKRDIGLKNDLSILYAFYARRNCYYIQIEGMGFYYLEKDIARLGVPQYKPTISLRLRAKTHSSKDLRNYSFFAVIVGDKKQVKKSEYDLQQGEGGRRFPPIKYTETASPKEKRKKTRK